MSLTVSEVILKISPHPSRSGYASLQRAAEIVVKRGVYRHGTLMSEIYPQVAEETGKTRDQVSRSIARATKEIWESEGIEEMKKLLGKPFFAKPSPGDMIFYLAYIATEGKLLED